MRSEFRGNLEDSWPTATAAIAAMRILVADDDLSTAIRTILEQAGFKHVDAVTCGRDALVRHARQPYDLLVLNRRMPPIGALEALQHLRAAGDGVPVIVTAAGEIDEKALLTLGVWDLVPKPFCSRDLVDSTIQALGVEQYRRSVDGARTH
jgi:two-component system OmpR family response regulator